MTEEVTAMWEAKGGKKLMKLLLQSVMRALLLRLVFVVGRNLLLVRRDRSDSDLLASRTDSGRKESIRDSKYRLRIEVAAVERESSSLTLS
jgi:hypothetical protein